MQIIEHFTILFLLLIIIKYERKKLFWSFRVTTNTRTYTTAIMTQFLSSSVPQFCSRGYT